MPYKFYEYAKSEEYIIDDDDPDILIVNPGIEQIIDENYLKKYKNLKL